VLLQPPIMDRYRQLMRFSLCESLRASAEICPSLLELYQRFRM
jgi:hypothetical protein